MTDGDQILRPSPLNSLVAIAVLGAMAVAAWSAQFSEGGHAWIPAVFLSALVVLVVFDVAGRRTYLRIGREGVTISSMFARRDLPWNQIEGLELFAAQMRWHVRICIVPLSGDNTQSWRPWVKRTRSKVDVPDNLGMSAHALAELLTQSKSMHEGA